MDYHANVSKAIILAKVVLFRGPNDKIFSPLACNMSNIYIYVFAYMNKLLNQSADLWIMVVWVSLLFCAAPLCYFNP